MLGDDRHHAIGADTNERIESDGFVQNAFRTVRDVLFRRDACFSARADVFCSKLDRCLDAVISTAAAKVSLHGFGDVIIGGVGFFGE